MAAQLAATAVYRAGAGPRRASRARSCAGRATLSGRPLAALLVVAAATTGRRGSTCCDTQPRHSAWTIGDPRSRRASGSSASRAGAVSSSRSATPCTSAESYATQAPAERAGCARALADALPDGTSSPRVATSLLRAARRTRTDDPRRARWRQAGRRGALTQRIRRSAAVRLRAVGAASRLPRTRSDTALCRPPRCLLLADGGESPSRCSKKRAQVYDTI